MALMFSRVARNYAKAGYYPTDAETLQRILRAIAPPESADGTLRIFDPCAGEGAALAELKHWLGADRTQAFAVEYDEDRAWAAKDLVDLCIHADIQDCLLGARQFGGLFLNPPYGDLVGDMTGERMVKWHGKRRLEKLFYHLVQGTLQFGGVMILVVPHYAFDRELSSWLSRHFVDGRVYLAPEQQFKQAVFFGARRRVDGGGDAELRRRLEAVGQGELPEVLPETPPFRYTVPVSQPGPKVRVETFRLDPRQLADAVSRHPGLWPGFAKQFGYSGNTRRPPLCALSPWHLALALASGQLAGRITTRRGDLLIKGATHKMKQRTTATLEGKDGQELEEIIFTDKFVPVIKAINLSEGPDLGQIITIQ